MNLPLNVITYLTKESSCDVLVEDYGVLLGNNPSPFPNLARNLSAKNDLIFASFFVLR